MTIQPPQFACEVEFSINFHERLIHSIRKISREYNDSVTALFFCLYDCVGMGISEYTGEWQINTHANIKNNKQATTLAYAKWCPAYFLRDDTWSPVFGNTFPGDKELLQRIVSEYSEQRLSGREQRSRFWGLCTHLLKEFKSTFPWKTHLPNCEVIFIGNGAEDGDEATKLLNDDILPSDFWEGSML